MEKLLAATVEFCKMRQQFGQAISKFQVLQHRMAALLKIKIGSAGRLVGQTAVQLHGGMGVSDELDVGHFFKRFTMINTLFGSHDEHLNE